MNREDIIKLAREATSHLSNHDGVRLQSIALLAFDKGAAAIRARGETK